MPRPLKARGLQIAQRLHSTAARLGTAIARRERLWLGVCLTAVGLVLGSFLTIHVALSRGLVPRWINTDPEEFLLSYESASSWIPGVIRVHGLTLRGSDPSIQWFARMEDVTIQISLIDLLFRRFHATRVRARDLTFRLREREQTTEISPPHVARLPDIPGFANPPRQVRQPAPLPTGAEKGQFWAILVEDLIADPAPEIWIEIYRFRGHARVTGSFLIHPHARAWVGPATVQFLQGDITLAPDQPLLSRCSGSISTVISPYDPERVRGDDVWPLIDGEARLEGQLADLRFFNHFLRRTTQPRLEDGEGTAKIALRFRRGIGTGHVDFEEPRLTARYGQAFLRGRAAGRFEIPRWDQQHGDLDFSGSRIALTEMSTAGDAHPSRDWWGRFDFDRARLRDGLDARPHVTCRDARPLYTLLGAQLPGWAEGILRLDGLEASARVRLAHDLVDVQDLDAAGGNFHLAGRYRERGNDRQGAFLIERGALAVGVEIAGGASRVRLLGARSWFARAAGDRSPPASANASEARLQRNGAAADAVR